MSLFADLDVVSLRNSDVVNLSLILCTFDGTEKKSFQFNANYTFSPIAIKIIKNHLARKGWHYNHSITKCEGRYDHNITISK